MSDLITPEQVPLYVPGEVFAASDQLDWQKVALRGYRYYGQDVHIPPMRDFMIVSYKTGDTPMQRRCDGPWAKTTCAPGSISLLTRAQASRWHWTRGIDVLHVYLEERLLRELAAEALDGAVDEIHLRDILNVEDPVITGAVQAMRNEAENVSMGGRLYVDAVAAQLGLHLLRHYASVSFNERADDGGLAQVQQQRIDDFIDAHLDQPLELATLAQVAELGQATFSRRFRKTFSCAPYAYVIERRVQRARELIERTDLPLKQIAPRCGFNDQAHMTRQVRARLGITPGELRRQARR